MTKRLKMAENQLQNAQASNQQIAESVKKSTEFSQIVRDEPLMPTLPTLPVLHESEYLPKQNIMLAHKKQSLLDAQQMYNTSLKQI